jgi:NADP-dependent 3-hydroxy acid dehydrogenase YdfG
MNRNFTRKDRPKERLVSRIKNKVIVITGASSGIGEATAIHLAQQGAKLVLAARGLQRLESVAQRIEQLNESVAFKETDVRRRDHLTNLVDLALGQFGKLDVFISNAGIGPISLLDDLRVDDWDDMIDVNLKGTLYGIAAALPVFRNQGFGHFINIISTAGLKIVPTMAVYAATKNAVRTLTEGLRQEAGPKLRVTGISPGFVKTNLADSMTVQKAKDQITAQMNEIAISPEAVARAVAFAIEQPDDVDVGDIVIRPTAQG